MSLKSLFASLAYWSLAVAMCFGGAVSCGTQTVLVAPGQPILTAKPVTLPAGSWARLTGVDANGNPTWAVSTSAGTVPAGYLIEPLPTQPAK